MREWEQKELCKASTINTNHESLDRTETTVMYVERQETAKDKAHETKGLNVFVSACAWDRSGAYQWNDVDGVIHSTKVVTQLN